MRAQRAVSRDDDWLVVDPSDELEAVVRGFRTGDVGMSLVQELEAPRQEQKQQQQQRPRDAAASATGPSEAEQQLRAELARAQQQIAALAQENQAMRTECAQLTQTVKQSKEILAKYVHEKEVLERSAVDAEEVSTVSVQFLSATEARIRSLAWHAAQLMQERFASSEDAKEQEALPEPCVSSARTFETAMISTETAISELECAFGLLRDRLMQRQDDHSQPADCRYKISLTSFNVGDLALFFPTPHGDFLAFNAACPHHYLSEESKALIGQDKHFRKFYVLGKIVYMEAMTATASNNPFKLPIGTVYHVVSVTSVTHQIEKRSS